MLFHCPICQSPLHLNTDLKSLGCEKNHQFDRAKQGYFNLLPVQHKKSKQPGDSKEMIAARHDFLNADYYQPLALELTKLLRDLVPKGATCLDLGCGEGYYSRNIQKQMPNLSIFGMDISKPAIVKAAAQDKQGQYFVASSDKIPLLSACLDAIFKVYAPANEQELARLVKPGGVLISVMPGPRHLMQIREFIYQEVRPHDTQHTEFSNFTLVKSNSFNFRICPSSAHRIALLQMTPFAWKASKEQQEQIALADNLDIELDFVINCYRRLA